MDIVTLNKKLKYVIIFSMVLLTISSISFLANVRISSLERLSKSVTQNNIARIKLGMDKCKIIKILGKPIDIRISYIVSANSNNEVNCQSIYTSYMYSNPWLLWDISIYVVFDYHNKVSGVYMKEFDLDFFIYDKNHMEQTIDFKTYNEVVPRI